MKRKGRLLKTQQLGESNGYAGEGSPYWDHAERHGKRTDEGTILENKFANPDVLAHDAVNTLWGALAKPELAELLIERFADERGKFPILSNMENKLLAIFVQHGDVSLTCKTLKISRSSFNTYLARIRKKFKRLLPVLDY